jgi:hypothetical protein
MEKDTLEINKEFDFCVKCTSYMDINDDLLVASMSNNHYVR